MQLSPVIATPLDDGLEEQLRYGLAARRASPQALTTTAAAPPPEWNPKEGGHPQPGDRPLSPGIVTATAVAYPADDPWAGYGGAAETSRLQVTGQVFMPAADRVDLLSMRLCNKSIGGRKVMICFILTVLLLLVLIGVLVVTMLLGQGEVAAAASETQMVAEEGEAVRGDNPHVGIRACRDDPRWRDADYGIACDQYADDGSSRSWHAYCATDRSEDGVLAADACQAACETNFCGTADPGAPDRPPPEEAPAELLVVSSSFEFAGGQVSRGGHTHRTA
jgi:hypothetical protein